MEAVRIVVVPETEFGNDEPNRIPCAPMLENIQEGMDRAAEKVM